MNCSVHFYDPLCCLGLQEGWRHRCRRFMFTLHWSQWEKLVLSIWPTKCKTQEPSMGFLTFWNKLCAVVLNHGKMKHKKKLKSINSYNWTVKCSTPMKSLIQISNPDLEPKHNRGPAGLYPPPHPVVHHPPLVARSSPTSTGVEVERNNCLTQTTTELLPSLTVFALSRTLALRRPHF